MNSIRSIIMLSLLACALNIHAMENNEPQDVSAGTSAASKAVVPITSPQLSTQQTYMPMPGYMPMPNCPISPMSNSQQVAFKTIVTINTENQNTGETSSGVWTPPAGTTFFPSGPGLY